MKPVVADHVSKQFGSFTAVDAVDLEVDAGEVVGLIGANGAGKTTFMKMLLGLTHPTSGSIRLFGEAPGREQRRRVGYVPQNLGLYRDLTAPENLEFFAAAFGAEPPRQDERSPLVRDLPLGVRRTVAFTAATQHRPELLILDEPTSGVSPLARSDLWGRIRTHAEAGTAVLVSTHYMEEADQADRVVLMAGGRVAAMGSVEDIVGETTAVVVHTPDWADAFDILGARDWIVMLDGSSIRVAGVDAADVSQALSDRGVRATISVGLASLEETMALAGS